MNLQEYMETISEITAGAVKELAIERSLESIEEAWRATMFDVSRFIKGESERGLVLGGVDEIAVLLEDHVMTIQSMAASRYVEPFRELMQEWEKRLALISEVSDVWIQVQRKYVCARLYRCSYFLLCVFLLGGCIWRESFWPETFDSSCPTRPRSLPSPTNTSSRSCKR